MVQLRISLFHRLHVHFVDVQVNVEGSKVQELFCFLVLYRAKAYPRETLAEQLWSDASASHSRRYLRKALWQLQHTFDVHGLADAGLIVQREQEWIQVNPNAAIWLDTAILEEAYELVR
jgi:DNA-binding SARP family transcriptional activator